MIKKTKEILASRKLTKLLRRGLEKLPPELAMLKDIVNAIRAHKPKEASVQFQMGLRDKLLLKHQELSAAAESAQHEKTSENKVTQETDKYQEDEEKPRFSIFQNFAPKKLAVSLSIAVLVLFVGGIVSYPFIPAPQVLSAPRTEGIVELSRNAPFKIIFTQPMNRESVEDAFSIEPDIEGHFEWERNVLYFYPEKEPELGKTFKISISNEAKSLFQKNLEAAYTETYKIVKPPEVLLLTPANGSIVDQNAKITVMFDQPMKALTTLDEDEKKDTHFTIEPAISGRFKWLGSKAFQFIPDKLPLATHYKVTIKEGLSSSAGGQTEIPYITEFDTLHPYIQNITPAQGNQLNGPDTIASIEFNQIMNLDSAAEKIILYQYTGTGDPYAHIPPSEVSRPQEMSDQYSETPVVIEKVPAPASPQGRPTAPASFEVDKSVWKKVETKLAYQTWTPPKTDKDTEPEQPTEEEVHNLKKNLEIHPENPLNFSSWYLIEVQNNLAPLEGNILTDTARYSSFKTVGKPELKAYFPGDYEKNFKEYFVKATFSNPMDLESLKESIKVTPQPKEKPDLYFADIEDTEMIYYFEYQPSTDFKITIPAGIKDKFGQTTEKEYVISFKTSRARASFRLLSKGQMSVLNNNFAPVYYLESTNLKNVQLKFKALEPLDIEYLYRDGYFPYDSSPGDPYITWQKELQQTRDKKITTKIDLNSELNTVLKPGFYYLEVSSPDVEDWGGNKYLGIDKQYFVLTDTALTLKQSKENVLIWATDLKTGNPVQNIDLFLKEGDRLIADGRPNANGVFRARLRNPNPEYRPSFYVIGKRDGGDMTFLDSNWEEGISAWQFNLNYNYAPPEHLAYVYTDRPIYRPGHTVYFKGIVRREDDATLSLPKDAEINVKINDAEYKEIFKQKVRINVNGTFSGEVKLSAAASVGQYSIEAYFGEPEGKGAYFFTENFWVAEYRKPEFKLDLIPNRSEFINGEQARIAIKGSYFFGAPLQNAKITYGITSTDYYFSNYQGELYYSFSKGGEFCYFGCSGSSEFLAEGTSQLDENGNGQITIPLEIADKKASQLYSVEITAQDLNNQTVSNRVTLPIHQGEYYLGIRTDDYIAQENEPFSVQVISVDLKGKPVDNKKINLKIFKRNWNTVKKQNVDGSYYYESSYDDKEVKKEAGRTDKEGKAQISITLAEGGDYRAVVSSVDERGNAIEAATSFYVTSSRYTYFGRENNDRIELIPDKPEYQIGETAKILIKSPYEKVKALITLERGGILEEKIIEVSSNSQVIEIPITEKYLPNVYVSLVLVKGSGEDLEHKEVSLKRRLDLNSDKIKANQLEIERLDATMQANFAKIEDETVLKQVNQPFQDKKDALVAENNSLTQQNAAVQIEIDNLPQNKKSGQSGEDAGIAAFKVGYANLIVNARQKKLAINIETDKKKYLPGDTVKVKVTAKDQNGTPQKAEVSLSVVDASILTLTDDNVKDMIQIFYAQRPIGVNTAQTLVQSIQRINVDAAQGAKGGGGGSFINNRADFRDSAYWNAVIETNDQGSAEISFKLSDNLTTWQILGIGATQDTLVGTQKTEFLVAQDIMIRPVLPRFLITGDKVTFGAIVNNQSDQKLTSQIFLDVKGLTLVEDKLQPISVEPGAQQKIEWHGTVGKVSEAKFKYLVEQGRIGDQVEITLPVYPFSSPEVVATAGLIQEPKGVIEEVQLPKNIDPELGELSVSLAPTLANGIAKGIEYLVQFPYGCAEQTASSLLPNLIVKQIIDLPAFSNDFINQKNLQENIEKGLQRLYNYQKGNGGWGLWEDSIASPYTTAYVLFTLHEAKKAGYSVDENIFNNGISFLKNHINSVPNDRVNETNTRAFVLYILSEIENGDLGLTNNLYQKKSEFSLAAKAQTIMNYQNIVKKQAIEGATKIDIFARMNTLQQEIENAQIATERGVQFEEPNRDPYIWDSDTRSTAIILQMFTRVSPANPLTEKILRHLLIERKDGSWKSTQETIYGLMAMIEFLKSTQELQPNFWGAIELNNKREQEAYFSRDTLSDKAELKTAIEKLLLDEQTNQIKLVHGDGTGNLYYDINLKYFLPLEYIEPRDEGIEVLTEYYDVTDTKELSPQTQLKLGQTYKVKVTLLVPNDRNYVVVEDNLPAGLEAIDFNLKTSSQIIKERYSNSEKPGSEYEYFYYNPFVHHEVRDDRVLYFADELPRGVHELEFFVRATSSGKFHDKPVTATEMYFPEVFGRSEGKVLEILETE